MSISSTRARSIAPFLIGLLSMFLVLTPALAAKTVQGKVTYKDKPVSGLIVKAIDKDSASHDDVMGSDRTDNNGKYSISYKGGHWDPSPSHRVTSWRPDIYIQVYAGSRKLFTSKTHNDWPHRKNLTVDVALPKSRALSAHLAKQTQTQTLQDMLRTQQPNRNNTAQPAIRQPVPNKQMRR